MRIAIAGTGGFALSIAHHLQLLNRHPFILLSRTAKPDLASKGWQIIVVDYADERSIRYALAGIDTVISTIPGHPEIALINAAAAVRVRRFIPSGFERPSSFNAGANFSSRGGERAQSLVLLEHYRQHGLESAVFACGALYERFAPGGLAAYGIGSTCSLNFEGSFLLDIRQCKAHVPAQDANGQPAYVRLTSLTDFGRFVVAALDMSQWPPELHMCGERLNVKDIVHIAGTIMGRQFETAVYDAESCRSALSLSWSSHDWLQQARLSNVVATAECQYDFAEANLNKLLDMVPIGFSCWLQKVWVSSSQSITLNR